MKQTFGGVCRPLAVLALAMLGTLGLAGPVQAKASLKEEVATIAKQIFEALQDEGQQTVAVGDFTGPAQLDTNFGPGMAELFRQELTTLKVSISKDANLSLKGRYARIEDKDNRDLIVVKLTIQLLDRNDDEKKQFRAEVRDNASIAQMLGVTVSLPAKATRDDRNEKIKEAVESPHAFLEGTRVRAKKGGEYAVEVVVNGQPRKPTLDDKGNPFVDVKRGEIYHVRVYNDTKAEGAVSLSIDGLDQFHFSKVRDPKTGKPKYSNYIVPAGGNYTIEGWHKDNTQVDQFLVTEYGKGAASQAKVYGKTGVLTVTFRVSALNSKDLPEDDGGRGATENETGFGPPKAVNLKEVTRTLGVERDIISIRYTR